MDNMQVQCNVLLLGKSGAGKSTLANYVFGADFASGTGKPVTSFENNFQEKSIDVKGVQVRVFDSVGLEMDNTEKWLKDVNDFLNSRTNKYKGHDNLLYANDLIHALIYVINASSARTEDLAVLGKIPAQDKLSKVVAITHCDIATREQIDGVKNAVRKYNFECIEVSSTSRKTRGGAGGEQFGKDELLKKILEASYNSVGKEMVIQGLKGMIAITEKLKVDVSKEIDDYEIFTIFSPTQIPNNIENMVNDLEKKFDIDKIAKTFQDSIESYNNFLDNFGVDFEGKKDFSDAFSVIEDSLSDFEPSMIKKMEEIEEKLESGDWLEKLDAGLEVAKMIVRFKSTIKDVVNEGCDEITSKLKDELYKLTGEKMGENNNRAFKIKIDMGKFLPWPYNLIYKAMS